MSHSTSPLIPRPALFAALLAAGGLASGVLFAAPQHGADGMHGPRFAEMDANGDDNVSIDEFDALRARHLAETDRNNDGFVSFEEHEAVREARARKHFTRRHDGNNDGRVSVDELAARGDEHFEWMDRNDDGILGQDERRVRHVVHRRGPGG